MKTIFLFLLLTISLFAQNSPCDLNGDGKVDGADVSLAVSMATNSTPCINVICTSVTVQRVISGTTGQGCPVYQWTVVLTWIPGTADATHVAATGFNIYRSTTPGGTLTKLNVIPDPTSTFSDGSVGSGLLYYYEVKGYNASANPTESTPSNQLAVQIPKL